MANGSEILIIKLSVKCTYINAVFGRVHTRPPTLERLVAFQIDQCVLGGLKAILILITYTLTPAATTAALIARCSELSSSSERWMQIDDGSLKACGLVEVSASFIFAQILYSAIIK